MLSIKKEMMFILGGDVIEKDFMGSDFLVIGEFMLRSIKYGNPS